tara:strand:- start:566 stop:769 length:204 start_codon:yes stop_codon:yes gene_type:complete
MSKPEIPLKIMGWHMDISWTDGKIETITDFPNDISQAINDYLTELEVNRYDNEFEPEIKEEDQESSS